MSDIGVRNGGAGCCSQLKMAGQEVSVEVRLDDQFDRQARNLSITNIFVDVSPRINNHRSTRGFITDQI